MLTKIMKCGSIAALLIVALPRNIFVMLELVSLILSAVSLAALKRIPRLSIASITDPPLEASHYDLQLLFSGPPGEYDPQPLI